MGYSHDQLLTRPKGVSKKFKMKENFILMEPLLSAQEIEPSKLIPRKSKPKGEADKIKTIWFLNDGFH